MFYQKSYTKAALEKLSLSSNTEAKIQKEIVEYLRIKKIFVFAIPNGTFINNPVTRILMYLMGLWAGVSDLIILKSPGKAVFLEVKTPKGVLSQTQRIFKKIVESLGFEYYVCRNLNDVDKYILRRNIK